SFVVACWAPKGATAPMKVTEAIASVRYLILQLLPFCTDPSFLLATSGNALAANTAPISLGVSSLQKGKLPYRARKGDGLGTWMAAFGTNAKCRPGSETSDVGGGPDTWQTSRNPTHLTAGRGRFR